MSCFAESLGTSDAQSVQDVQERVAWRSSSLGEPLVVVEAAGPRPVGDVDAAPAQQAGREIPDDPLQA